VIPKETTVSWWPIVHLLSVTGARRSRGGQQIKNVVRYKAVERAVRLRQWRRPSTESHLRPLASLGYTRGCEPNHIGTHVLLTSGGLARQVADGIAFPNGMAVMPDNSTLPVKSTVVILTRIPVQCSLSKERLELWRCQSVAWIVSVFVSGGMLREKREK
jgi:hypothetical protein